MVAAAAFYLLLVSALPFSFAASDSKPAPKPCTIHSPSTGAFVDLRTLQLAAEDTKSPAATNASYHSKGYDYPSNFSLNLCGPVVEELKDVQGVPKNKWANVSAFYTDSEGDVQSLGHGNQELLFRGKRLLMNYTMGSPCPELDEDGMPIEKRKIDDDDDDDEEDDDKPRKPKKAAKNRRKSTMLSFICDTSPLLATHPAISFVGTMDHCTYNFEVRSRHVCGGTTTSDTKGTLGPAGVFGVILGIALMVYVVGGVVYQRNVMHQRGWRQLPNYAVWAGIFGFISVSVPQLSPFPANTRPLGHVRYTFLLLHSASPFCLTHVRRSKRRLPPCWS